MALRPVDQYGHIRLKHIALFFIAVICFIPAAVAEDIEPPGYMPDSGQTGPTLEPDIRDAEPDVGPQPAIEDKIKWVEEKVTPTTRWIENMAKPFTTWIEGKIHGKEKTKTGSEKHSPASHPQDLEQAPQNGEKILPEAAIDLVRREVDGEVLKVKYVQGDLPFYRVKLISKAGEIRIFHVHAVTGKIVSVTGQFFPRPPTDQD